MVTGKDASGQLLTCATDFMGFHSRVFRESTYKPGCFFTTELSLLRSSRQEGDYRQLLVQEM